MNAAILFYAVSYLHEGPGKLWKICADTTSHLAESVSSLHFLKNNLPLNVSLCRPRTGGHPSKYWPNTKLLDMGDRLTSDSTHWALSLSYLIFSERCAIRLEKHQRFFPSSSRWKHKAFISIAIDVKRIRETAHKRTQEESEVVIVTRLSIDHLHESSHASFSIILRTILYIYCTRYNILYSIVPKVGICRVDRTENSRDDHHRIMYIIIIFF